MIQHSCRFLQIIVHQIYCFFKAIKQRQLIIVNCLIQGCNNATRARVELSHAIRVVLIRRFLSSRPRSRLLDRNLTKYRYKASRGGVKDTRLETKDTKKIRGQGQGQPFRGQTLSRPRTKDTSASALQKKKKGLHKKFLGDLQKKKKKIFTKIFQTISTK